MLKQISVICIVFSVLFPGKSHAIWGKNPIPENVGSIPVVSMKDLDERKIEELSGTKWNFILLIPSGQEFDFLFNLLETKLFKMTKKSKGQIVFSRDIYVYQPSVKFPPYISFDKKNWKRFDTLFDGFSFGIELDKPKPDQSAGFKMDFTTELDDKKIEESIK